MPWHQEPMKDATNGETPRGAVSKRRSAGIRMGKPTIGKLWYLISYKKGTQGIEMSQYLQEKKVITILLVATSERERA